MKTFTAILALVIAANSWGADSTVQIELIAGKSPKDVAAVLGKPSREEPSKLGAKHTYRNGQVEVRFIAGRADWITVSELGSVPFNVHAIEALGLKPEAPTFHNENVIRWEPHSAYKSISVFPLNGKVDYAYIRVATK